MVGILLFSFTQMNTFNMQRFINVCFNSLFILLITSFSFGQQDRKLTAYLQTKQFVAPEIGNYLEIQIQFVGHTINYLPKENGLIGEVALQFIILSKDSVIASDAYRLETPFMADSIIDDFYDVKRFALEPGSYTCKLQFLDLNSTNDPINANFKFSVEDFADVISISDIIIAETAIRGGETSPFYKSGFTILPRISTFYPTELTKLPSYIELYNTEELGDTIFGLKQFLVNAETGEELTELTVLTSHKPAVVVPVFRQIDITKLPTGKYTLNYTLIDRSMNELSTQSYEFERSNDYNEVVNMDDIQIDPAFQESIPEDKLDYYLLSLIPISKPSQTKLIIAEYRQKDSQRKRRLIQAYWKETAGSKMYETWLQYQRSVQKVEDAYSTNYQRGYETDRGRVYLQYGEPSRSVQRENSASEYPYEIWEYNKIGVFSNKKFIFYNTDLVNNNFKLLHSDMVGELKNPRWSYELAKRNTQNGNVDNPDEYNPNSWGNNSRELFGR